MNEDKRIEQFRKIANDWDKLPEKVQGRLEGTISTLSDIYVEGPKNDEEKEAG